jgi:mycothiol synthase
MALPAGSELRAPTWDDLGAVGDLLVADELDDSGETVLGADFIREEWSRAGFDLAADAWVIVDEKRAVAGYGQAMREQPTIVESWGIVRPEHRGRGMGSTLLDRIEERASEQLAGVSSPRLRHAINADDGAAASLLRARGFRPVRHFWHMGIDVVDRVEARPSPPGIQIGGIDPGRALAAVHAVLDEAFAGDWDHHPEPVDRWIEEQTSSPSYDASLWLLATDAAQPIGALTASLWDDRGWVNELGVLPSHRGRGIAAALLRRSFVMFAARGVGRVLLNVDAQNPTGATALYERVGMRVVRRWDLWERSLTRDVE